MFYHKCKFACCLRRPCLPVLWCVDFVEAIQDPRRLFKVKRPEYYMFEVVIDESWRFNLLLFLPRVGHLCNLVVVKRNIVLSTDARMERISATAAYHWIEVNKTHTIVTSWTQADKFSGSYDIFCNSWVVFFEISPDSWRINNLPDDRTSGVR